ncbi:MAG: FUSC family protein [Candidatus Sulfotelmatobacter sp.]
MLNLRPVAKLGAGFHDGYGGEEMANDGVKWKGWPVLVHSVRTAVVAVASLLAARLFRLPQSYWAPITTLVITQSSLGAALTVSWQRFVGTALGAVVGGIVASYFGPHALVFGICIFLLGLLFAVVRSDQSAYRFGGIALAIVLLVPRTAPAWQMAFHRFAEVSIGIAMALIFAWVWPEKA